MPEPATLDRLLADLAADLGDPGIVPLDAVSRRVRRHQHRRRTTLASGGALASALVVAALVLSTSHSAHPATAGHQVIATITELSGGMENTLSVGERVNVVADPHIRDGDIVAFDPDRGCNGTPVAASAKPCGWVQDINGGDGHSADLIKRVIAVGGDTVSCPPSADNVSYCTRVVVNGKPLDEPYVFDDDHQTFAPVKVPAGQLYVLGDHRGNSYDSRYRGTLAASSVIGKVELP